MPTVKLIHNPRCSKSRQALAYLNDKKIPFETIEYLKKTLTTGELKKIAKKLKMKPIEFVRKKESVYKEKNLEKLDGDDLIKAIAENPILLERPILIIEDEAVIGRPIENIINLLKKYWIWGWQTPYLRKNGFNFIAD